MRRLSATIPSAYVCALLQTANKATGGEAVDEITVQQTRYFDLSNHRDLEDLLTALLEDDDKYEKNPYGWDSDSDSAESDNSFLRDPEILAIYAKYENKGQEENRIEEENREQEKWHFDLSNHRDLEDLSTAMLGDDEDDDKKEKENLYASDLDSD